MLIATKMYTHNIIMFHTKRMEFKEYHIIIQALKFYTKVTCIRFEVTFVKTSSFYTHTSGQLG